MSSGSIEALNYSRPSNEPTPPPPLNSSSNSPISSAVANNRKKYPPHYYYEHPQQHQVQIRRAAPPAQITPMYHRSADDESSPTPRAAAAAAGRPPYFQHRDTSASVERSFLVGDDDYYAEALRAGHPPQRRPFLYEDEYSGPHHHHHPHPPHNYHRNRPEPLYSASRTSAAPTGGGGGPSSITGGSIGGSQRTSESLSMAEQDFLAKYGHQSSAYRRAGEPTSAPGATSVPGAHPAASNSNSISRPAMVPPVGVPTSRSLMEDESSSVGHYDNARAGRRMSPGRRSDPREYYYGEEDPSRGHPRHLSSDRYDERSPYGARTPPPPPPPRGPPPPPPAPHPDDYRYHYADPLVGGGPPPPRHPDNVYDEDRYYGEPAPLPPPPPPRPTQRTPSQASMSTSGFNSFYSGSGAFSYDAPSRTSSQRDRPYDGEEDHHRLNHNSNGGYPRPDVVPEARGRDPHDYYYDDRHHHHNHHSPVPPVRSHSPPHQPRRRYDDPPYTNQRGGYQDDAPPGDRQQATAPERPMLEVAPGLFMHLMGTDETMKAIQDGNITITACVCCSIDIHCSMDVEYILCPDCRVVSPVDQLEESTNSVEPKNGGLVGLGIKTEMLLNMMDKVGASY